MADSIAKLRGLGPKSEAMIQQTGILTLAEFMQSDPFDIYALLKKQKISVSLNLLYAMIGAQENVAWQEIKQQRKSAILMRLDDMGIAPN